MTIAPPVPDDTTKVTIKKKHPLAKCEECPWYKDSGYAESVGPEDSDMLIVGIAPGTDEVKTGVPFTGPSGKLLDRVLAHHKLDRSKIRLTNVVACHPKHRKAEDPPKEAIAACAPRLSAELQSRQAIILLGKIAFQTVLQTREGITKARQGPARTSPLYPGARIVPTFHPAAALRSSDYFPSIVRDIKKIKESEASIKWEPPKFSVFDDEDTVISALQEIDRRNPPYITLDIECAVEKDESLTHPDSLLCIGIGYDSNKAIVIGEKALKFSRVLEFLKRFLHRHKVICHNGKFDIQVMMRLRMIDNPYMLYADTMLASYCLDERPGHHGLKGLASEVLGAPDYCVSPDTKILKTDLTWQEAKDIQAGDLLVGFTESSVINVKSSKVLEVTNTKQPCFLITTDKTSVISSSQHRWPIIPPKGTNYKWRTTQWLYDRQNRSNGNYRIPFFGNPWDVEDTREAGYLAGFFDGEGHLVANPKKMVIGFGQNPGPVRDNVLKLLNDRGFKFRSDKKYAVDCISHELLGGAQETRRFIGTIRPERFIARSSIVWSGQRTHHKASIINIEYLGEMDVVGLKTSTGTFIANGLLTHNSAELKPYIGKGASKNYGNIPRPLLYQYNAYDAALTFNLWADKFERDLEENNLRKLHDFLVAASNELIYLELEGIRIDQDYLAWLLDDYAKDLANLEEELSPWVANPRSTPQVLAACQELMLMNKSTGAAILEGLLEGNRTSEQREFLGKILHYRKEAKLYGTYVKGTLKRLNDGRLYTTFKLHGTVTGRLSSANPNLQNIVRGSKIKNLFVPNDGNVFIQADYKQAEWRAIACLAKDSYLQKALSDPNQDIHSYVATLFFGPNFTKEQRVMAKTFVFGVAFGRGPDAVAAAFRIPVYKAQQYIDDYFRVIPDVVKWRKDVHEQIFKGGQALRTPFGRKRRYWLITKENKHDIEKESLAFLPQSIASDLTLHSLIKLRKHFEGTDAKIRLTVHDSILAECPKDDKIDVGREMRRVMESTASEVFSNFVPFPVDLEYGISWGNLSELT